MNSVKTTRNLWPVGIVTAFILFGLGTASLIVLACTHKVDLVSSNYYEQEIKFQGQLDRLSRANSLGARAVVSYDATKGFINIAVPSMASSQPGKGVIHLYRPSSAKMDCEFPLLLDEHGKQSLDAATLPAGLWKVRVSWTSAGQEYLIDEKVVVPHRAAS